MTAIQQPLDGMPVPPPADADYETWVETVWDAFVRAADSGLPFTTSEVAKRENLPDPPKPQSQWGKLPGRLVKAGLIRGYDTGNSSRRGVHGSLVHTWIGIPAHQRAARTQQRRAA